MDLKTFLDESCQAILANSVKERTKDEIIEKINNEEVWNTVKEYFSSDTFVIVDNPEAVDILNTKFTDSGYFEDVEIKNKEDGKVITHARIYSDNAVGYVLFMERRNKQFYIWNQ